MQILRPKTTRLISAVLALAAICVFSGCAAAVPYVTTALNGGVTVYKKATESGPKAEFVLFKVEVHHDIITQTSK
jgi:hypothetical protein